jgi:hypothetical protein
MFEDVQDAHPRECGDLRSPALRIDTENPRDSALFVC